MHRLYRGRGAGGAAVRGRLDAGKVVAAVAAHCLQSHEDARVRGCIRGVIESQRRLGGATGARGAAAAIAACAAKIPPMQRQRAARRGRGQAGAVDRYAGTSAAVGAVIAGAAGAAILRNAGINVAGNALRRGNSHRRAAQPARETHAISGAAGAAVGSRERIHIVVHAGPGGGHQRGGHGTAAAAAVGIAEATPAGFTVINCAARGGGDLHAVCGGHGAAGDGIARGAAGGAGTAVTAGAAKSVGGDVDIGAGLIGERECGRGGPRGTGRAALGAAAISANRGSR